jgi:hypothetical protein
MSEAERRPFSQIVASDESGLSLFLLEADNIVRIPYSKALPRLQTRRSLLRFTPC